jgi:hypothetical protein
VNKRLWYQGHVDPWWDDDFKSLDYQYTPIKNTWDEERWISEGYVNVTLNGALYAMPNDMPDWALDFQTLHPGWSDVSIGFFRMDILNLFPLHRDHFIRYQEVNQITDPSTVWRSIVFLEDWKSGHYFEIESVPIMSWRAGDWVSWNYDVEHFAGNFGVDPRYTMQITGTMK